MHMDLGPWFLEEDLQVAGISHVGRNKVAKTRAGTAQLGKSVQTPCRETNVCLATEVPEAIPVACSGLPGGGKAGIDVWYAMHRSGYRFAPVLDWTVAQTPPAFPKISVIFPACHCNRDRDRRELPGQDPTAGIFADSVFPRTAVSGSIRRLFKDSGHFPKRPSRLRAHLVCLRSGLKTASGKDSVQWSVSECSDSGSSAWPVRE